MKYKKTIIVSGILCVSILMLGAGLLFISYIATAKLHHLPPENYTSTNMYPLKRRIVRFAELNNRLPHNLSELPPLDGFTNKTTDVWGNEINYTIDGATVILTSYGKDQKPGGVGDNRDVTGIIETKTAKGDWVNEQNDWENWKLEPLADKK